MIGPVIDSVRRIGLLENDAISWSSSTGGWNGLDT